MRRYVRSGGQSTRVVCNEQCCGSHCSSTRMVMSSKETRTVPLTSWSPMPGGSELAFAWFCDLVCLTAMQHAISLSSFSDSDSTPPALCGHSMSQRWFPEQLLSRGTTQQTREVRGSELSGRRGRAPPSKWDENMAKKGWINVPSI